jgi:uncharacterized protein YuzE
MITTKLLEPNNIGYLFKATVNLIKLPQKKMWLDYDEQADVLYLHFEEKPSSTHSEMREDGIIIDYRDSIIVGMTILDASHR